MWKRTMDVSCCWCLGPFSPSATQQSSVQFRDSDTYLVLIQRLLRLTCECFFFFNDTLIPAFFFIS